MSVGELLVQLVISKLSGPAPPLPLESRTPHPDRRAASFCDV